MVEAFRVVCPAPIISLRCSEGEQPLDGAEYRIAPDPESLLADTAIPAITGGVRAPPSSSIREFA